MTEQGQFSSAPPQAPHMMRWVSIIIILGFILAVIFGYVWFQRPGGSVTLLTLNSEGVKQVQVFSLKTGALSPRTDVDASLIRTDEASNQFTLSDGSIITTDGTGIVMKGSQVAGNTTLLVATPIPAKGKVPLAVWNDGARIAWVNPADHSLQVFEKNSRGTYLPIYLDKDLRGTSLGFTEDGLILVVTKSDSISTEVVAVNLNAQSASVIKAIPGVVMVIQAP